MPKKAKESEVQNFKDILQRLEGLVDKLENDSLPLEESLKAFEIGITLTISAQNTLAEAEQAVKLLLERNDKPFTRGFEQNEAE